jgi:(p)ppGpp synthase/HD superfamily hydrolase
MIELTPEVILIAKAKRFADTAHGLQMYGTFPYTYHLGGVASLVAARMKGDPMLSTYVAAAWLHDVLEDTTATYKDLVDEFGLCIAEVVQYLTKVEGEEYEEYIRKVLKSAIAREIKICDTMFNLESSFRENNAKRVAKYARQLDILVQGVWYECDY